MSAVSAPVLSVVSGCSKNERAAQQVPEHIRIAEKVTALKGGKDRTLTLLFPKGCRGNLTPTVNEFYRLTQVRVELREGSLDEISNEVILENQIGPAGTYFDVAIPATFGIPDLVEAGAVHNLDALAEEHEPAEMNHSVMYTVGDRYKGKLYGYQADGDAYLMFYNQDWLTDAKNRAGYEDEFGNELAIPSTWSELDRQMKFFHRPEQGRFGGSLYRNKSYIAWEFWSRFHAKGVYPVADDMTPRLNSDAGLTALRELLAASKYLEPGAREQTLFENFRSYADGSKYCNIGWGGTQKYLNGPESQVRGRLAYGSIPGGVIRGETVPMPYFNWGWNYVVSSKSKKKELAYLFVLFASTPMTSTRSVREASGYFDPYRAEHYRDPQIKKTYGEDFLRVHQESLKECIPDFYLRGRGRYFAALKQALYAADRGQLSPKTALEQLSVKWTRITEAFGRDEQIKQWLYLKSSYPKRLRALLS